MPAGTTPLVGPGAASGACRWRAANPGGIIAYATSAGSTALDGTGRNGLFTGHLLKNLKTPGLEIAEVFKRTGAEVKKASGNQQIPAVYNQFFDSVFLAGEAVVTPGDYPLTVTYADGRTEAKMVTVTSGQTVAVGFTFTPAPPQPKTPDGFVFVQGETFQMGSNDGESVEKPVHSVTVTSFLMGRTEVTQAQYAKVMGTNPSYLKATTCQWNESAGTTRWPTATP